MPSASPLRRERLNRSLYRDVIWEGTLNLKTIPVGFIIAGVLAFILLAFVSKFELFGYTCYYIGSMSFDTACIKPPVYWGAWLVVAGCAFWGYRTMTQAKAAQPPTDGAP